MLPCVLSDSPRLIKSRSLVREEKNINKWVKWLTIFTRPLRHLWEILSRFLLPSLNPQEKGKHDPPRGAKNINKWTKCLDRQSSSPSPRFQEGEVSEVSWFDLMSFCVILLGSREVSAR